jgi:hypothetical protein
MTTAEQPAAIDTEKPMGFVFAPRRRVPHPVWHLLPS